jgi:hypothetical protein
MQRRKQERQALLQVQARLLPPTSSARQLLLG